MIRSGLSDHSSGPVRTKVDYCKSHDHFGCQVTDCSATRIPSSSIMDHHPPPMGGLVGGRGFTSLQRCKWSILQPRNWFKRVFFLCNRIEPKIENILRKNQNGFQRNRSMTSQILTIRWILEGVCAKNLQVTILLVNFTKAFDSIHRGKREQILPTYSLPKETIAVIMMLYRNTKVKVRSPDGDTDYFDIVIGVLQGDTLAPYLFIICLDMCSEYLLIKSQKMISS